MVLGGGSEVLGNFAWKIYLQPRELSEPTPGGLIGAVIASTWSRGGALKKFCKTVSLRRQKFTIPRVLSEATDVMDIF